LRQLRPSAITTAIAPALAALALVVPAHAGTLSGTAAYRERIALPPDAVFEAVLIDVAIADAPARVLGRARLQPAGQSPFRFSIPYRDSDLTPAGRFAVRATVRQGKRLLFTTDTFTPVLKGDPSQPLRLKLVSVPQSVAASAAPSMAPSVAWPSLRGTLWKLMALQDSNGPTLIEPPGRPPELLLAVDQERVSGTDGCNRLAGGFRLAGEELSFSRLISTQMACLPDAMAYERRYGQTLAVVRRWSIDKRNLLLQNGVGRTLLLFRDGP
jgi:putative lipoprotein